MRGSVRSLPLQVQIRAWQASQPDFAYLDIGCSEGAITVKMAAGLGLRRDRAHACDCKPCPESAAYQFTQCNIATRLPYADASFDFFTMFMSAHHFIDLSAMLMEVRRVARPGALFLLRDSMLPEEGELALAASAFYDVVHALYATTLLLRPPPTEGSVATFLSEFHRDGGYATYHTQPEWIRIAAAHGFAVHAPPHGPTPRTKFGVPVENVFDAGYILFRMTDLPV